MDCEEGRKEQDVWETVEEDSKAGEEGVRSFCRPGITRAECLEVASGESGKSGGNEMEKGEEVL